MNSIDNINNGKKKKESNGVNNIMGLISFQRINLTKLFVWLTALAGGWYLLAEVVPDPYYSVIAKVLVFLVFVFGYILKGEKPLELPSIEPPKK